MCLLSISSSGLRLIYHTYLVVLNIHFINLNKKNNVFGGRDNSGVKSFSAVHRSFYTIVNEWVGPRCVPGGYAFLTVVIKISECKFVFAFASIKYCVLVGPEITAGTVTARLRIDVDLVCIMFGMMQRWGKTRNIMNMEHKAPSYFSWKKYGFFVCSLAKLKSLLIMGVQFGFDCLIIKVSNPIHAVYIQNVFMCVMVGSKSIV